MCSARASAQSRMAAAKTGEAAQSSSGHALPTGRPGRGRQTPRAGRAGRDPRLTPCFGSPAESARSRAISWSRSSNSTAARCESWARPSASVAAAALGLELGPVLQVGDEALRLGPKRPLARAGNQGRARDGASCTPPSRAGPWSSPSSRAGTGASSRIMCAFVPEIPNDETAARRLRSPAGQLIASLRSFTSPSPHSTYGDGSSASSVRGSVASKPHDHLDQAGHSRCRLRVADVALHRAEPDRPVGPVRP